MSRDYNRVILMGRLARDPEVRTISGGQKAARFTVCTGRQWKNKATGQMQSHTDFICVTAWGVTADIVEKYTHKGGQVLVEGRISTRDYTDRAGERKFVTEVTADSVVLLGGGQSEASAPAVEAPAQKKPYVPQKPTTGSAFDDDFPMDFSELGAPSDGGDVEIPF